MKVKFPTAPCFNFDEKSSDIAPEPSLSLPEDTPLITLWRRMPGPDDRYRAWLLFMAWLNRQAEYTLAEIADHRQFTSEMWKEFRLHVPPLPPLKRRERAWSAQRIARALKVTREQVEMYDKGSIHPSQWSRIRKLAVILRYPETDAHVRARNGALNGWPELNALNIPVTPHEEKFFRQSGYMTPARFLLYLYYPFLKHPPKKYVPPKPKPKPLVPGQLSLFGAA